MLTCICHKINQTVRCVGVALLVLFAICVNAGSEFVEIPQVPDTVSSMVGWLLSSNDGFGHNYGTDEDNLRTFGIDAGVYLRQGVLVHADLTSFTDRNADRETSLRIDELKILGAWRLLNLYTGITALSVFTGAGMLLYGDFGTLSVQEGAHGINNDHTRPVPEHYDRSSAHALAYLYTDFRFPALHAQFCGYGHLTHDGDYNAEVNGGYWIVKPLLQSAFRLSYRWNKVAHAGSAAANCYEREDGPWLSNRTFIGPLLLERGFNLENLNQYSYAGFRLGDLRSERSQVSPFGFTYSIGWPIGHNSWIEFFRCYPLERLQRVGFFLRTYHTENLIENTVTRLDDDRQLRRTKETSIGAEVSFFDPDEWTLLDGFLFAGTGFTRDMLATYDQFETRFLDRQTRFMVHCGAGLRVLIPDVIRKVKGRAIGAEIRANFRFNNRTTGLFGNPDLLLDWGLVFTER